MSDTDAVSTATSMPVQAHTTGLMGLLADRRQAIINEQILTLEVPRWTSPQLKIEFKPIDHAILKRGAMAQERIAKDDVKKQADAEVDTNADILINSCVRIIAVLSDGTETGLGPNGAYTRFDADVAASLGMPESSNARAVCKAIFITTADLLLTAKALGERTGYREGAIEEALVGE